jgi:hypothetical protein
VDISVAHAHPPNRVKEEQGHRALEPLVKVLVNLPLLKRVPEWDSYRRRRYVDRRRFKPTRLSESSTLEGHRQRGRPQLDKIAKAEGALESNATESDRVESAFVGVPESA